MKKRIVFSIALAAAMGTMPTAVSAAEVKAVKVQIGDVCELPVDGGTGKNECLQRILDGVNIIIGNAWNYCPGIEIPGTGIPDEGEGDVGMPDTETPDEGEGGVEIPDEGEGDVEMPDTETPDEGEGDAEMPDTETPDVEIPDVDAPDTEIPDMGGTDTEIPDVQEPDEADRSFAEQVVSLVNQERAKAGLPALEIQSDIAAAANVRAKEIKQSFSHTRPNGTSFSSALKEQGVTFMGSGENIAYGQRTPEQVMEGWMNSDGHRANILNARYKNIGVGYYQDERGVNYWVQLFTY